MTELISKNASIDNNGTKDDEQLKYMEFTKNLEEDIKQQLRKFKNDICKSMNNGASLPAEETDNNNVNVVNKSTRDDQDTIDYVKQMRDNVDKQLIEFRKALKDISENVRTTQSGPTKGFNPEMIETVRSFRSEIKSQYEDFCDLIKELLKKQQEESNRTSKDLPTSVNKIIKDDTRETYNLINDEFFKLRQFMVEVIKISQTRKATKMGEIGQLPVNVEEQQPNHKNSISSSNFNKLVAKRNELNVIKKNIKNQEKQKTGMRWKTCYTQKKKEVYSIKRAQRK